MSSTFIVVVDSVLAVVGCDSITEFALVKISFFTVLHRRRSSDRFQFNSWIEYRTNVLNGASVSLIHIKNFNLHGVRYKLNFLIVSLVFFFFPGFC